MSKIHKSQRHIGGKTFAVAWRVPLVAWQIVFFVGPLLFMIVMSFFLVKNYRMLEAFEFVNWIKMLQRETIFMSADKSCEYCKGVV